MMILSGRSFLKSISVISFVLTWLPNGKCESENRINNYEGYKIYELIKTTQRDLQFMDELHKNSSMYHLDFLRYNRLLKDANQVMVPPQYQRRFENDLKKHQMQYRIYIDNVKRVLDRDRKLTLTGRRSQAITDTLNFNNYYRYNEISAFLDILAKRYPNTVTVEIAGYSYEGRPIKIINIFGQPPSNNKPIIFIDAGIHAREWIAPASALYLIQELVVNSAKYRKLLNAFNFVIMPLVNPDGYEYTHTNDRLWRKTRKPYGQCYGTDGNRNFDFMWCTEGVSTNPCEEIYCGPTPFSEPETIAVKEVMHRMRGRCKMYISLHAFGSYVLHPWGFGKLLPDNIEAITDVGQAGADAIKRATGQTYSVGSSAILLYEAAGGSDDYAMAVENIPFAYTLEVGNEEYNFDPPPSQIRNLVRETWIGIQAMINKVMEKYMD